MKKYVLVFLLLFQILLIQLLSYYPEVVETFFSNGFYPIIAKIWRLLLGKIPFSVGDVAYFVLILLILKWCWTTRTTWRIAWKDHLLRILNVLSIFYLLFNLSWALNYHRIKLPEKMSIETEYSDAQLYLFTQNLIAKTNNLHVSITNDSLAKVEVPYSRDQIFALTENGYYNLAKKHPYFEYQNPSVKNSLMSLPLTYMGFSGYLNPFTNEAQVNNMLPLYSFAATTTHEIAHQIGYASESEANFVGYLAAVHNRDQFVQYSGYTLALRYCLRNWEIRDKKVAKELFATLNPGIKANFSESKEFWEGYESFIETGFKIFYDNFLKFNQQEEGLESYSRFVNLLVNYYADKKLD